MRDTRAGQAAGRRATHAAKLARRLPAACGHRSPRRLVVDRRRGSDAVGHADGPSGPLRGRAHRGARGGPLLRRQLRTKSTLATWPSRRRLSDPLGGCARPRSSFFFSPSSSSPLFLSCSLRGPEARGHRSKCAAVRLGSGVRGDMGHGRCRRLEAGGRALEAPKRLPIVPHQRLPGGSEWRRKIASEPQSGLNGQWAQEAPYDGPALSGGPRCRRSRPPTRP